MTAQPANKAAAPGRLTSRACVENTIEPSDLKAIAAPPGGLTGCRRTNVDMERAAKIMIQLALRNATRSNLFPKLKRRPSGRPSLAGRPPSDGRQLLPGHAGELAQKRARLLYWPIEIAGRSAPVGAHVDEQSADFRGVAGLRGRWDRHHAGPETISPAVNFIPLLDRRISARSVKAACGPALCDG